MKWSILLLILSSLGYAQDRVLVITKDQYGAVISTDSYSETESIFCSENIAWTLLLSMCFAIMGYQFYFMKTRVEGVHYVDCKFGGEVPTIKYTMPETIPHNLRYPDMHS